MPIHPMRRVVAASLIAGLFAWMPLSPALAGSGAELTGRVFDVDGTNPRSGVVVTLYDRAAESSFSSDPTDTRGAFRIASAPAGRYRVLVETGDGAYLASDALDLQEGANRPISLNLEPPAVGEEAPTGTPGAGSGGLEPWAKWAIVGGITLGAVVVVDAVSEEDDASGF